MLRGQVEFGRYTSYESGKTLRTSGPLASMGRVGSALDNATAESFFATLKAELVYRRAWPIRHELEMKVFSYIEGFYNPRRRHTPLDNLSPAACEQLLLVWRRPSLRRSGTRSAPPVAGVVTTGSILLALVLGLVFPWINYLGLFLLFFTGSLERSLLGSLAPTPG